MEPIQLPEEAGGLRRELGEGAYLLYWAGFGLIGVFITTILSTAWPVALLQPAWQERVGRILIEAAIFPLVGACLVVLAALLQPASDTLARRMRRVRRLAYWAAIGFALLIPLMTLAGVRQLRGAAAQGRQRLEQVRNATVKMEKATTAAELREAILQIPGIEPPQLPASFDRPIPELRARLVERLRPRIKAVENRLEEELAQRWQRWMLRALRDALMAGFLAVSFAAIGRSGPQSPSLLRQLTHRRSRRSQGRGAAARGGIPREWLPEEDPAAPSAGESGRIP